MNTRFAFALAFVLAAGFAVAENGDIFEEVSHHYVENDGVKLHYVSAGEGPAVVFLHGFPDFWYTWRNQMAGLKDSFQVVAMDLRAYNKSDKPEGKENYSMELLLSDVDAVVNDLGKETVTIVGHDWGGAIAWRYAMMNQDKVDKLIICNLTHPNGYMAVRRNATPEQKANTAYIERFQDPNAHKMFNAKMLANMVAGKESDVIKERFEKAFENSSFDGMLNYYRAIWPTLTAETDETVPQLEMPVLQFHGLKDTAVDKDGLRDTWNWIDEDYTLVTVPESGHWVQTEAADMVTTTMKWWLKSRE